jgi:hypothetical protein
VVELGASELPERNSRNGPSPWHFFVDLDLHGTPL